jgi:hypothetical protein
MAAFHFIGALVHSLWRGGQHSLLLLLLLLLIRSTTSLCIYGLLYHLLYVYLYDRWFPEPRG